MCLRQKRQNLLNSSLPGVVLLFLVVALFVILQAKYLKADHSIFAEWAKENGRILMVTNFVLLLILATAGEKIYVFLNSHHGYYYGIIMICVLGILEVLRLKDQKKQRMISFIFSFQPPINFTALFPGNRYEKKCLKNMVYVG